MGDKLQILPVFLAILSTNTNPKSHPKVKLAPQSMGTWLITSRFPSGIGIEDGLLSKSTTPLKSRDRRW